MADTTTSLRRLFLAALSTPISVALAAAIYLNFTAPLYIRALAEADLRVAFGLEEETRFSDVRVPRAYRDGMMVEGTVDLSQAAYDRLRPRLTADDRPPLPIAALPAPSAPATWTPLQRAIPPEKVWQHISEMPVLYAELARVRAQRGLMFCRTVLAIQPARSNGDQAPVYALRACADTPKRDKPAGLIFGVLDDETRTLTLKLDHAGLLTRDRDDAALEACNRAAQQSHFLKQSLCPHMVPVWKRFY